MQNIFANLNSRQIVGLMAFSGWTISYSTLYYKFIFFIQFFITVFSGSQKMKSFQSSENVRFPSDTVRPFLSQENLDRVLLMMCPASLLWKGCSNQGDVDESLLTRNLHCTHKYYSSLSTSINRFFHLIWTTNPTSVSKKILRSGQLKI